MRPSVGRIVHYRPGEGEPCEAAIVTWIADDDAYHAAKYPDDPPTASLAVFVAPTRRGNEEAGIQLPFVLEVLDVPEGEGRATWHWPERVE